MMIGQLRIKIPIGNQNIVIHNFSIFIIIYLFKEYNIC